MRREKFWITSRFRRDHFKPVFAFPRRDSRSTSSAPPLCFLLPPPPLPTLPPPPTPRRLRRRPAVPWPSLAPNREADGERIATAAPLQLPVILAAGVEDYFRRGFECMTHGQSKIHLWGQFYLLTNGYTITLVSKLQRVICLQLIIKIMLDVCMSRSIFTME